MPKRSKSSGSKSQSKAISRRLKENQKERARLKREYERELKRHLKALQKIGAYKPTSKNLTKSRQREVRRRFKKFEQFLTADFAFIPILAKKPERRQAALKMAAENQLATAPRGVFVERTRYYVKGRAKRDRKTGEYKLIIEKRRRGETGEKEIVEIILLRPMGELAAELERIKREAEELGPIGPNDRIAFKTYVNGNDGYSHNIYSDADLLARDIAERYDHLPVWFKHQFFRSITVQKTTRKQWLTDHPLPVSNPYKAHNRTGRSKPLRRHKPKIRVKRIGENWGVFINDFLDSEWRTKSQAEEEARRLRAVL